jgi:Domain of unknown function DUF11
MGRLRRACAPLLLSAALVGAMFVSSGPASATLQLLKPAPAIPATFVGHGGYSADGLGQDNTTGGTVQAEVPAGSTVVQAYLYGTYFDDPTPTEADRTIDFDGTTVVLDFLANSEPGNSGLSTARGDVTAQVAAKVGSGGGITDFAVNTDPPNLDGVALVVIYSNPDSPEVTVAVLDGGSKQLGDQVTLNFAAPINPAAPGFSAIMSLGSGFSAQLAAGHDCGGEQFSTVTVNDVPLTSCAGNYDDGVLNNGALITVGGVGDSIDNPVDGTSSTTGTDDELYNLAPLLNTGDTSLVINTTNPSQDDNLFLAVISVTGQAAVTTEVCDDGIDNDGDGLIDLADPDCVLPSAFHLDLTPASATNPVGTEHTVTATLTDNSTAVDGGPINFTVTGVNPTTGSALTDASGVATFTYTGTNPGDDTITACYEQTDTPPCEALASATKTWSAPETSGPTVDESSEPPTVTSGNNVLQTFTVTNASDVTQTNVGLAITFPAGATVQSSNPEQGTCTAGPATLTCSLGTIASGATVTIPVTVQVPVDYPPGLFAPAADVSSDQSGTGSAGPLPGSTVVAPTGGEASGYVPPGGTLTTGDATPANPTAASFTLPNSGSGAPISLTTEESTPTFCGNQLCRGRLLTLSPFGGGYDDPKHPPVLDISIDKSVVRRFGPAFRVWVQKEDTTIAPVLVPNCMSLRSHGRYWWHWRWHTFKRGAKIAMPSPCVAKRYFDRNGDSHVEILVLQGDPKFGRR